MYNYKRGIIVLAVISLMIFTPLIAMFPLTSAQNTASSSVGTVTFNPSGGAFPGQIVTYTWSGLPGNLVPPVYVTVYLNGVPYSTGLANYSTSLNGGTLTGSFVMPNDQPGTNFMVSLSYKDNANNYGVSSTTSSSGSVNVYASPLLPGKTVSTNSASTLTGVPYTVLATVNFTKNTSKLYKYNAVGVSGYDAGYLNSNYNVSSQTTTVYPKVNQTLYTNENVSTMFEAKQKFNSLNNSQNVTVNATAYETNKQLQLSLAASSNFNSTFTGYFNNTTGTKYAVNITSMYLRGYINQTVEGTPVNFEVSVYYSNLIANQTGTYTGTGQFFALAPKQLIKNFTGSASVTWDITSLSLKYINHKNYVNITYTLSVKLIGNTNQNLVYLNAQYLNSNPVTASYVLTPSTSSKAPIQFVSYKVDTLTVQAGYTFYGAEVDLENPGIAGIIYNEIASSTFSSPLISTTMFSNFTKLAISTLAPGYTVIFNQTGKTTVYIPQSNLTIAGYVNITLKSINYSPGVAYIENATWTFSVNFKYNLTNGTYKLQFNGSGSGTGSVYANNSVIVAVATTGVNENVNSINEIKVSSYIFDKVGYPYLTYFYGMVTYSLYYPIMNETANIAQNFSLPSSTKINLTSPSSSPYMLKSYLTGFNKSLSGNINLYVNASKNIQLVLFGIDLNQIGYTHDYLKISGTVRFNNYVTEVFTSNLTYSPNSNLFKFNNSYGAVWQYSLSNNTSVSYTLAEVWGEAYGYTNIGFASFNLSGYYGEINITGKSNSKSGPINLWKAGSSNTSLGNITSTAGFENKSILGYYNTTYTVLKSFPALYGLSSMNGEAMVNITVDIHNVSHNITYDPYFSGVQNVTPLKLTIYSNQSYYNTSYNQTDKTANLTVVGITYRGYLDNVNVEASFEVTDPLYNLTNYYNYSLNVKTIPFMSDYSAFFKSNLTFEKGDVPTTINNSNTTIYANITSPLVNLTLQPSTSPNISLNVAFTAINPSKTYYLSGSVASSNVNFMLPFQNLSKLYINLTASGSYYVAANIVPGTIVLQGTAGPLTFTSTPFNVLNDGSIPITGTVTSEHGSGTFAGWFNVSKYYPVNSLGGSVIWGSGYINAQEFSANGSQYYAYISLQTGPIGIYENNSSSSILSTMYDLWNIAEMPNSGTSSQYSFQLLNGSGALITGINNATVAEIATLTGKYVNMSLSQLNAKIIGIYSELNTTYVSINTNFGVMEAQLSALNANITAVSNGVATIQTSLGTIQASLNSLNAKIVAINGTVATIQTDIGTINTSLASINAQLTSIQGNIATIQTSLGTIQGTVTSINGSVATIKTQLGTLQTSVNGVTSSVNAAKSSTSNAVTFEVLILVLVLITLVIAIGTLLSANRMVRRLEELKKQ